MAKTNPGNQDAITLTIETPMGKWENASFDKNTKVKDVIKAIIAHFQFATNGNYQLKIKGQSEALKPERPLVSYHLENGTVLVFTDLGNGA